MARGAEQRPAQLQAEQTANGKPAFTDRTRSAMSLHGVEGRSITRGLEGGRTLGLNMADRAVQQQTRAANGENFTEEKKTPGQGDYIRGNVAEPDPNGEIHQHEGVITRDNGKTYQVVDPGIAHDRHGFPHDPEYGVREVHKEGAQPVEVPINKQRHVDDMRRLLDDKQ